MKSRKAISSISVIIGIALLMIFFAIYGVFQVDSLKNLFGSASTQIDSAKDHDGDGLLTLQDDCPCVRGSDSSQGCPVGATEAQREDRTCLA